ncbi:MAG: hypothetical protein RLZZ116_282 [Planctomycetota bacterium]
MHPALPEISRAELSAVVRAVRARLSRDKELRAAAVAFSAVLLISLHSASLAAWNPSQAPVGAPEENQMLSLRQIAVVSSLAVSSSVLAQNAVQWRVQDGGNGHWYRIVSSGQTFQHAKTQAESIGGHLATITSAGEQQFIAASVASGTNFLNAWIGLAQDPGSAEPAGGWRWVTGEALGPYNNWWMGVPQPDNSACGTGVAEDFVMWAKQWGGFWADVSGGTVPGAPCTGEQSHAIVEWSADCNNDGVVDYGQIRLYQLADQDLDNVPDCCESPAGCQRGPIQWRQADGGNGHWYALSDAFERWPDADGTARQLGGDLASITSAAENQFVTTNFVGQRFWLGGRRSPVNFSQFIWVTNEAWTYSSWAPGEPNTCNPCGQAEFVIFVDGLWDDTGLVVNSDPSHPGYHGLIEFSADCNNDGIVDFGQIRDGTLVDTNSNNVPDCCESTQGCNPCPADVDGSGAVNGVDLAAILNVWGTSGGKYPGADVNHDGIVDGADLSEVLNGWGACP